MRKSKTQLADKIILVWVFDGKIACSLKFWSRIKSPCQGHNVWNHKNNGKDCLHRRTKVAQYNLIILLIEYSWSVCINNYFSNHSRLFYCRFKIIYSGFMCKGTFLSTFLLQCSVVFTCRNWAAPKMVSVESSRAAENKK